MPLLRRQARKLGETITERLESIPCTYKVIYTVRERFSFHEHQPLNRQSESFGRQGIHLGVSTLADWVGACTTALTLLVTLLHGHVLAAGRIHDDDTTVPVLAKHKTPTGRLWT